jgi:acyl dehydratase
MIYWFDDFTVGEVFESEPRVVELKEMLRFAREFDPQPFHIDLDAARQSSFGGIIASGLHTASLLHRLVCDRLAMTSGAALGSPGVEKLRWLQPLRPGDALRARITVTNTRPSNSRPDVGLLWTLHEGLNQRDEVVIQVEAFGFFRRRPRPDGDAA